MKGKFFISLILSGFSLTAQPYIHLPEANATWKMDYYNLPNICPPFGYCYSFNCSIIKDTVVGGFTYHLTDWILFSTVEPTMYREDTVAKKVYCLINGQDFLLYDFTLQPGDTLNQYDPDNFSSNPVIVSSIDSVFNGINYLKRWNFTGGINPYPVIEGAGSMKGLFGGICFFEAGPGLNCLIYNSQTIFPDISFNCSLVGMDKIEKYSDVFYISPNPVLKGDKVTVTNKNNLTYSIKIVDFLGKTVLAFKEGIASIDTNNIQSGIYIIKIIMRNGQEYSYQLSII